MHRFFVPQECFTEGRVTFPARLLHRLRDVLRLGKGDRITVIDDSGWEYEVELCAVRPDGAEGFVVGGSPSANEPRTRITLYQALLKGSSFERVLQKCTEIGVASFAPVICDRCVAGEPAAQRVSRWKRIILEAAQQSRRGAVPALHEAVGFRQACETAGGSSLLLWEGENATSLLEALRSAPCSGNHDINIFVGPEGGFTAGEVEFARDRGVIPVTIGRRILRAETAGLIAAALTFYESGDLT